MSDQYSKTAGYWWRHEKGEDVHTPLWQYVEVLKETSALEAWRDRVHEGLYTNRDLDTSGQYGTALSLLRASGFSSAKLNVARSAIDTLVAKIGKNRPAIKAKADDADWTFKKRARGLTKFIRGLQEREEIAELAPEILRDACVVSTGAVHVTREFGKIVHDRVPRDELLVDARSGRYGKPRQLHRRCQFAREVLSEMFPDFKTQIWDAPAAQRPLEDYELAEAGDSNMIDVAQSWHLPSGPDAKDGRIAIIINGATLLYEEWDRPRFPFAFLRYSKQRKDFWGQGLMEQLAEIQWKINETVRDIQEAIYYGSQLIVWARRGSNVPKNHLGRRQRPSVVEYDGAVPPQYTAPNPVSKDQLQFLQMMIDLSYDLTGISKMDAQSKSPLGANASGAALMEHYDQRSERFSDTENAYAAFWKDLAELEIDEAKAISEQEPSFSTKWSKRTVMQTIKWKDVDMARDTFTLSLEPANFLPDTRAGKLEATEQLAQAGVIQGPWVSALLGGFPDLERANRLRNAPLEYLESIMEDLADEDIDEADLVPDAYMNLELGVDMAKAELNRACSEGAPEAVKDRFRRWIRLADTTLNKGASAAPPPDPMAEGFDPMSGRPPMPGEMAPPVAGALPPGEAPVAMPGAALPGTGSIQ